MKTLFTWKNDHKEHLFVENYFTTKFEQYIKALRDGLQIRDAGDNIFGEIQAILWRRNFNLYIFKRRSTFRTMNVQEQRKVNNKAIKS